MPPNVWFICVILVFAALYVWAVVAPSSGDNFGNFFFPGFGLIIVAAALAKGYQRKSDD